MIRRAWLRDKCSKLARNTHAYAFVCACTTGNSAWYSSAGLALALALALTLRTRSSGIGNPTCRFTAVARAAAMMLIGVVVAGAPPNIYSKSTNNSAQNPTWAAARHAADAKRNKDDIFGRTKDLRVWVFFSFSFGGFPPLK